MQKQIPLQQVHEKLGAKMMAYAGFQMPIWYSSGAAEHQAVREKVGIFDVSHMGEFVLKGPNASDLVQYITSNDVSKLALGQAQYSCFPNTTGGIVDDLIVYKIQEDNYLLVVNASNIEKDWGWIAKHNTHGVDMEDHSENTCLFAVQGPQAKAVLQQLTDTDLSAIKYYHFTMGTLAGIPNVLISNTGYTGAGGVELYVDKEGAHTLWNSILEAGKTAGIVPVGLGARDTLRLEKGYCLYGNDIDDNTSPLEAGLGWITKLNTNFAYHEVVRKQRQEGLQRKLVGFKMIDRGVPRHSYEICNEHSQVIGRVTSGAMSPTLNIGIGLGYVQLENAVIGKEIYISVRNKPLRASIERLPFI